MLQDPGPTLIGERVNSQGSRKVKRLLLEDDYDSIVQIARRAGGSGAHMLDVCVALTERDDEEGADGDAGQEAGAVGRSAADHRHHRGRTWPRPRWRSIPAAAIINGNNLENGRERIDQMLPIAKKHGAARAVA